MKAFFAKIGHLFEQLDHEAIMFIHFLDAIFTGQEVQAAIGYVTTAATMYVDQQIAAAANTDRREWVVGELVKFVPGMSESRARVLTETVVGLAKKEVDGLLTHLSQHYENAAVTAPE